MKYQGRKLLGPRIMVVPIIRDPLSDEGPNSGNIYIQVQGVTDMTPFECICPMPTPPMLILPGNQTRANMEDKNYKAEINAWWSKRSAWIAITSLSATQGLEWEKVKLDDPSTYTLYGQELAESGFSDNEIGKILNAIREVNGLNEDRIEEARQSFLTEQAVHKNGQSSQKAEVPTTPSGEPAEK